MSSINNLNQLAVPAQDSFLYQLIYNKVYGGNTGCTININGTTVQMGGKSSIDVLAQTISGGTGCFVSGVRPYVYGDSLQNKYVPQTFVSVWDTSRTSTGSSTATQIRLPLNSAGSYNFIVDWGDGSTDKITTWNQAQTTHTYATAGVYQLTITGTIQGFRFANTGDRLKLLSVFRWGVGFRLGGNGQYFDGCSNLDLSEVEDVLDLTGITSLSLAFRNCTRLSVVNRMNEWNISNITTLASTFIQCPNFNTYVGDWDTSNVTDMSRTFDARGGVLTTPGNFNQDISKWNTSKVTTLRTMFQGQPNFNQNISTKVITRQDGTSYIAWDTSNVNDMAFILNAGTDNIGNFNQNISNWNTSKVTTLRAMFQTQPYFNQDISTKVVTRQNGTSYIAWDTSNVTDMAFMLTAGSGNAGQFNQNIGNWNTSKVTLMNSMLFAQVNFNQDISTKVVTVSGASYIAWDTSNVTSMAFMFGGFFTDGKFNQNIGNWNTNKVTTITQMFVGQPYFNQDISTKQVTVSATTYSAWSVSAVTNMEYLFYCYDPITSGRLAGSFNNGGSTSINNWDTRRLTGATDMFNYQIGFNQPIGNWNISGVTTFSSTGLTTGFMFGKTFNDYSTANYDALLIGWATRNVRPNQLLNMGTIKYTSAAVSARNTLTSAPNNWTIIDGGLA
jgi:surface protein